MRGRPEAVLLPCKVCTAPLLLPSGDPRPHSRDVFSGPQFPSLRNARPCGSPVRVKRGCKTSGLRAGAVVMGLFCLGHHTPQSRRPRLRSRFLHLNPVTFPVSPQIQRPAADPLCQPRRGADPEQLGRRRVLGPAQPGFPPGALLQESGDAEGERGGRARRLPCASCSVRRLWTLRRPGMGTAARRGLRARFGLAARWPPSGRVA